MASFSYKGLKDNKYIDGVLDAEDRDEAVYKLLSWNVWWETIYNFPGKTGINHSR